MNEHEKKLIDEWLKKNKVKVCPDSYDDYQKPSLSISAFSNQKSCIPKTFSWKDEEYKPLDKHYE